MPRDFEIKDTAMLWAPVKYIIDAANYFGTSTNHRSKKQKVKSLIPTLSFPQSSPWIWFYPQQIQLPQLFISDAFPVSNLQPLFLFKNKEVGDHLMEVSI